MAPKPTCLKALSASPFPPHHPHTFLLIASQHNPKQTMALPYASMGLSALLRCPEALGAVHRNNGVANTRPI